MAKPERMVRLLQGDVGSGKTLVAFLAMLTAVEAGAQAALMAPTELLARQHFATIAPLAEAAGVTLALLTGRDGQRQKKATLQGLADGTIQLVVGTHALVQDDVEFADLALAVVDEQHRFGVHQRMALSSKSQCGRPAGHDRDADPAHPDAGGLRRPRRLQAHREAGRPPADRHAHHSARAHRRGGRGRRPHDRRPARASTGSAR